MTMPDSDITMDDVSDGGSDPFAGWSEPQPSERLDDLFDADDKPTTEALKDSRDVDAGIFNAPPRKPKAVQYEKKVQRVVRSGIKGLVTNPATVSDAAALIMYGPDFAEATGNLAAESIATQKVIDFLTDTTENAGLAMVAATLPLALQILRNHEPSVEVQHRQVRIPFTKRALNLKVNLRLPHRARAFTEEPATFTTKVLTDPDVAAALEKQGIRIVRH